MPHFTLGLAYAEGVSDLQTARRRLKSAHRVAVLTGAGISKPSGIPTFRDAAGLWREFDLEEYATPSAYARNPQKVWEWYAWRYKNVLQAQPNLAHALLVELERSLGEGFLLVTQNVDGLHRRAGSRRVVELHGDITRGRCERCGQRFPLPAPQHFTPPPLCPGCGAPGRPDVVWFGETLPEGALERAIEAFTACEVALVIGTSAEVEPAASLGRFAYHSGAYLIELNPEATALTPIAHCSLRMGAPEGMEALMRP
jgi:NAD-dependent deacetylase